MFNTLDTIEPYIIKRMKQNPNRSLSALFRNLRMKVPLIGDYPVLRYIIKICAKNGYTFNRRQIILACQSSIEFKNSRRGEKTAWTNDFMNVMARSSR